MLDNDAESGQFSEQIVFVAERSVSTIPRQLLLGTYNSAFANRFTKNYRRSWARIQSYQLYRRWSHSRNRHKVASHPFPYWKVVFGGCCGEGIARSALK